MSDRFLFRPTDIAPLAVFRILAGLLLAAEGFGAILTGWVYANYVSPDFTFNFIGFDFLQVLNGPQAYAVYDLLGLSGLGIALGWRYRLCAGVYALLWTAVYLGQKTSYNNHYYLLMILSYLLWIIPAHRFASADAKAGRVLHSQSASYWQVWLFKVVLLIVYTYAALAKLYPAWLSGEVMRIFLASKADWPLLGPLVDESWFVYLLAYGGLVFDLLVIPALWYKPTRLWAFGLGLFFHLFNSIVFQIGIFPYLMLASTVLFFEPAVIRQLFFKGAMAWRAPEHVHPDMKPVRVRWMLYPFLVVMIALPLRHWMIPGNVHWTEEGHRLSWHMMLRSKWGRVNFEVRDARGKLLEVVAPARHMSQKMAAKLATHPDMIWQYAQLLEQQHTSRGQAGVKIYAQSAVSLNGSKPQPLIDPTANLAAVQWDHWRHHEWILPQAPQHE